MLGARWSSSESRPTPCRALSLTRFQADVDSPRPLRDDSLSPPRCLSRDGVLSRSLGLAKRSVPRSRLPSRPPARAASRSLSPRSSRRVFRSLPRPNALPSLLPPLSPPVVLSDVVLRPVRLRDLVGFQLQGGQGRRYAPVKFFTGGRGVWHQTVDRWIMMLLCGVVCGFRCSSIFIRCGTACVYVCNDYFVGYSVMRTNVPGMSKV